MKHSNFILVIGFILFSLAFFQSHSDGRATRDRDNTGAPGGQSGGNGAISCNNCHNNGAFDTQLNLELIDDENNLVTEYLPNKKYTAKVTIETLSGATPAGYGFQMVSLVDADNSDVNGWVDAEHSSNVQLTFANSTGRVYAEHNDLSTTNEFTAEWTAPDTNTGDISFYIAGISANDNAASSGDNSPTPIKITFAESLSTNTNQVSNDFEVDVYPNPTFENLNINGDLNNKTIELYSLDKLIKSIKGTQEDISLELSQYETGLYIVIIRNKANQIVASRKVVKR